jgi:Ni/Co efflux regulator RcnB
MKMQVSSFVVCGVMLIFSAPLLAQSARSHDPASSFDHQTTFREDAAAKEYTRRQTQNHHGMSQTGRHEGWYRRGGNLPVVYRGRSNVVTDWRRDRLREPPRGYHWIRSDNGDFLLVAVTSGIIADLISHH